MLFVEPWFMADVKLGSLAINLEPPKCFAAEVYACELHCPEVHWIHALSECVAAAHMLQFVCGCNDCHQLSSRLQSQLPHRMCRQLFLRLWTGS